MTLLSRPDCKNEASRERYSPCPALKQQPLHVLRLQASPLAGRALVETAATCVTSSISIRFTHPVPETWHSEGIVPDMQ